MISYLDFKEYVVEPTLSDMRLGAEENAANLLMNIAAHESMGLKWLDQVTRGKRVDGPAYGPFQFEQIAFDEVERLMERTAGYPGLEPARDVWSEYKLKDVRQLRCRLDSAVFYARVLLYPHKFAIPEPSDLAGLYQYYRDTWRPGKPPSVRGFQQAHERWKAA